MTRLPKQRGITQAEADKSLTAHSKSGDPPGYWVSERSYSYLATHYICLIKRTVS